VTFNFAVCLMQLAVIGGENAGRHLSFKKKKT